jgi:hypothetical protein
LRRTSGFQATPVTPLTCTDAARRPDRSTHSSRPRERSFSAERLVVRAVEVLLEGLQYGAHLCHEARELLVGGGVDDTEVD